MFQKRTKKSTITIEPEAGEEPLPILPAKRPRAAAASPPVPPDPPSDITLSSYGDGNATYASESLTAEDSRTKALKTLTQGRKAEDSSRVYQGEANYPVYAEKSERDIYSSKFTGSLGPIKAPQYYRASCRFDYAMGICKDWKEAGYCGFGDGCIFVHDRSDYKSGYQMEKDWERQQEDLRKQAYGETLVPAPDYEIKEEETAISVCLLCGKEWKEPVITECGHVFCLACALQHYTKSKKCFECKTDTKGIFNNVEV